MAAPLAIGRRAGANLARAARRGLARVALPRRGSRWLELRLAPPLDELAPPRLLARRGASLSLLQVLETLDRAGRDSEIDGVLLRLSDGLGGWSRVLSLRRAVARLREQGVPVAAHAESLDAPGLLVASAATRLWLPETGQLWLVGLRLESFFLRGLLDRLHVRPHVLRVGTHKTVGDRLLRASMSPEEREQLEALADDLYEELVGAIAAGRGLDPAAVRERIDRGPYRGRAAVEAGLADDCLYADQLDEALEALSPMPPAERPGPRRVQRVQAALYHRLRVADPGWRPLLRELPRLAYVVAHGAIRRGGGPRGIGCDELRGRLERLRRAEAIRGVVLRLDSPGGDALASDLLWRSVSLLTREKPVVVSMGDVVASGGYYLAAAADALLAEVGTVTGSIGVAGGKLDLAALYERIGVGRDAVERGARAGLLSEARGFTPDERAAVRGELSAIYRAFTGRVAEGRGLSEEALDRAAQGRVWSGARARALGLVDAIGGPLEALAEVRRRAGIAPDEGVLLDVHPRPGLAGLSAWLRGPGRRWG